RKTTGRWSTSATAVGPTDAAPTSADRSARPAERSASDATAGAGSWPAAHRVPDRTGYFRGSRAWRAGMTQGTHQSPEGLADVSADPAVPDDLHALRAVVEGTAAGVGREFFRSLLPHLPGASGRPHAAVCGFDPPPQGRVLAFWDGDHVAEDLPFQFTTSPAAEVLHGRLAHFPTCVRQKFPRAVFLVERDVEGYMAVPVQAADGTVLGLISAFDRRPMPEEPRRLFILRIFAARAAAELLRLRAEQQLRESEASYRDLLDN